MNWRAGGASKLCQETESLNATVCLKEKVILQFTNKKIFPKCRVLVDVAEALAVVV